MFSLFFIFVKIYKMYSYEVIETKTRKVIDDVHLRTPAPIGAHIKIGESVYKIINIGFYIENGYEERYPTLGVEKVKV